MIYAAESKPIVLIKENTQLEVDCQIINQSACEIMNENHRGEYVGTCFVLHVY